MANRYPSADEAVQGRKSLNPDMAVMPPTAAGARGGRVVAMGRPQEVMAEPASVTGACLTRLPSPTLQRTRLT